MSALLGTHAYEMSFIRLEGSRLTDVNTLVSVHYYSLCVYNGE